MKPNASELCGLSGAGVVAVWSEETCVAHQLQSLELQVSQQAASEDRQSDERVSTKELGKRQSPGAGDGREPGTPAETRQTAGSITLPNILLMHSVRILSSRATHG